MKTMSLPLPDGNYATSLTIDNIPVEEVGRVLDLLRESGYLVEVNLAVVPPRTARHA